MKIVVIGGSGLIGAKLVEKLRWHGHEAIAASPASGVNTITGQGLGEALGGAQVVVDVANSPSFEDQAVLDFFKTSGRNLVVAELAAGVRHHVVLSVVGTDRLLESGYFRGKMAQEQLIKASGIPYTIARSTQFFEFLGSFAKPGADGSAIRLPRTFIQPIAADDVAGALAELSAREPANGTVEIAGPQRMWLSDAVRRFLRAKQDERSVSEDLRAPYFGAVLQERTLLPGDSPRIASIRLEDWLGRQPTSRQPSAAYSRVGLAVP